MFATLSGVFFVVYKDAHLTCILYDSRVKWAVCIYTTVVPLLHSLAVQLLKEFLKILRIASSRRDGPSPLSGWWWWCWWWSCRDDLLRVLLRVSVLSFLYFLLSLLYSTVDSNYSFDPILSSVLFETTSFLHPRICQSIPIMKHHPPTRFYSPPQFNRMKNVIFIPKHRIFTDFCRFFAHKNVKYEQIWK